jgi:hypothetical protein
MTQPDEMVSAGVATPATTPNTPDTPSSSPQITPLGVSVPWASVPDEALVPDNDTSTKAAVLKLPEALEARLAALEQAIVCPWACGASQCPWKCEVRP